MQVLKAAVTITCYLENLRENVLEWVTLWLQIKGLWFLMQFKICLSLYDRVSTLKKIIRRHIFSSVARHIQTVPCYLKHSSILWPQPITLKIALTRVLYEFDLLRAQNLSVSQFLTFHFSQRRAFKITNLELESIKGAGIKKLNAN